jgi:hypothetical protein
MNFMLKSCMLFFCSGIILSTKGALVVNFNPNPWSNSNTVKISTLKQQSKTVLHNEQPVFMVNMHNSSSKRLFVAIKLEERNKNQIPEASFCLRTSVNIRTKSGNLVADPLPRLNKERIISIPGGESRQVWLEFDASKLLPELHNYILHIQNFDNTPAMQLRLNLRILPLASNIKPDLLVWDCNLRGTEGKTRELLLAELANSGVNIFHSICEIPAKFDNDGTMVETPNFQELDKLTKVLKPHARVLLLRAANLFKQRKHRSNHKGYLKSISGKLITFGSPAWKKALSQWAQAVSKHLAAGGFPNSKWAFYPYDEYLGSGFVTFAKTVKAAVPEVQIFGNPAGRSTQQYLETLASQKLIDIICPTAARYYAEKAERVSLYKALKNSNVRKLFYFAGWPQKDFSPLKMYRAQSWKALAWNTNGWGYWTATGVAKNLWGGSPWDDYDNPRPNPESLYIEDGVVIPSRRWRAVRAGVEDYALINLVRQKATTATAKKTIKNAIAAVMAAPDDYKIYASQRQKMINLLIQLEGLKK